MFKPAMLFGDTSRLGRPFAKDPAVIRHCGRYLMYFSMPPYSEERRPAGACAGWTIGIAESTDLAHWAKIAEIVSDDGAPYERNGLCAPGAVRVDGKVHLFYQTYGNGRRDAICHAWSEDGIAFTRSAHNPVFRPIGDWNNGRAIDADVIFHKGKFLLFFATRDPAGRIQMVLGAESEIGGGFPDVWTQMHLEGAALRPEFPWEQDCVEAPALCEQGGLLYMFYAGAYNNAPQQIGCAVSRDTGLTWHRLFVEQPFLPCGAASDWNSSESGHPFAFTDDDGQITLFYQGNNDMGETWLLSSVKIAWNADGKPVAVPSE